MFYKNAGPEVIVLGFVEFECLIESLFPIGRCCHRRLRWWSWVLIILRVVRRWLLLLIAVLLEIIGRTLWRWVLHLRLHGICLLGRIACCSSVVVVAVGFTVGGHVWYDDNGY